MNSNLSNVFRWKKYEPHSQSWVTRYYIKKKKEEITKYTKLDKSWNWFFPLQIRTAGHFKDGLKRIFEHPERNTDSFCHYLWCSFCLKKKWIHTYISVEGPFSVHFTIIVFSDFQVFTTTSSLTRSLSELSGRRHPHQLSKVVCLGDIGGGPRCLFGGLPS